MWVNLSGSPVSGYTIKVWSKPSGRLYSITKAADGTVTRDCFIGTDLGKLFGASSKCNVHVINDADAAGIAEMRFGAGKSHRGNVLLLTLGTFGASGYSPTRARWSAKFTPAARTEIRTWPAEGGGGSGRSCSLSTDGGPCLVMTTARIGYR